MHGRHLDPDYHTVTDFDISKHIFEYKIEKLITISQTQSSSSMSTKKTRLFPTFSIYFRRSYSQEIHK